jgi:hypothetical protein
MIFIPMLYQKLKNSSTILPNIKLIKAPQNEIRPRSKLSVKANQKDQAAQIKKMILAYIGNILGKTPSMLNRKSIRTEKPKRARVKLTFLLPVNR